MDERMKGAAAHAVMEAGAHLRGANGGRKSVYDLDRKCRDLMLGAFRRVDPSLSMWTGSPSCISSPCNPSPSVYRTSLLKTTPESAPR